MKTETIQTAPTHTPGPWFTLDTGLDVYAEHPNPDPDYLPRRRHIAAAITTCQFDQEARANAALIAAAPELLAALVRARDHVIMQGTIQTDRQEALDQISAAIARATGQQ